MYSPPYVITAIGDVDRMQRALTDSADVALYREYVAAVGLGYTVRSYSDLRIPAFAGSLDLRYAHTPGAGPGSTGGTTDSTTGGTSEPTTSGTGSEATGIAIFDLLAMKAKTGIQSRRLKPTTGLIDPEVTRTLPDVVVASTGFDAMSHALETLTDVSYAKRARPQRASLRPVSQGANPFSDMVAFEAIDLIGKYLVRAVNDASQTQQNR